MSVRKQSQEQEMKWSHDNTGWHDTLVSNINVARMVMRVVGSTLGPLGMSKILLKMRKEEAEDEVILTSDGALVLESMKMEHPIAKLLAALAKAQKDECGDGATTAVIFSCSLLENAEELLKMGLHPSLISEGFRKAEEKADRVLQQRLLTTINIEDQSALRGIVTSVMNSRVVHDSPQSFELLTDFVLRLVPLLRKANVEDPTTTDALLALDNLRIVKKTGKPLSQSELVPDGFLIEDREVVHPNMPLRVENASIALVKNLEVKRLSPKTGSSPSETVKIEINSSEGYAEFMRNRSILAQGMAEKIAEAGANVVLVNSGIDDLVEHYLSRRGILAVKRVKSEDITLISKLTKGDVVGDVDELTEDKLGRAESVDQVAFSDDDFCIQISGCKGVGVASVVLRGTGKNVLDEAERCLRTALEAINQAIRDPQVVFGGGAAEVELARELHDYALSFSDKQQFAIQKFSHALEAIPRMLAQNAGMDAAKTMVDLYKTHRDGFFSFGIDATQHEIRDMQEAGIFDLMVVKRNAMKAATEVAVSILRTSGIERVQRRKGRDDRSTSPHGKSKEQIDEQDEV